MNKKMCFLRMPESEEKLEREKMEFLSNPNMQPQLKGWDHMRKNNEQ